MSVVEISQFSDVQLTFDNNWFPAQASTSALASECPNITAVGASIPPSSPVLYIEHTVLKQLERKQGFKFQSSRELFVSTAKYDNWCTVMGICSSMTIG